MMDMAVSVGSMLCRYGIAPAGCISTEQIANSGMLTLVGAAVLAGAAASVWLATKAP